MSANDNLKPALEHYRQKRAALLEEIRKISLTIKQLEIDLGEPPSDDRPISIYDSFRVSSDELPENSSVTPTGRPVEIRRDEFFGKTQSDAAKAYLSKVGHAVSIDELVAKLQAGGCKVGGANAQHTLYVSLVRNTREFVPVGDGFIGLRRFYPNLKTASAKIAVKGKRGRPKGKRKVKKLLVKTRVKAPPLPHPETMAHKVVYQLLNNKPHSRAEILQAGKEAGVMPIAILGLLKHAKDIERVGDEFSLKDGGKVEGRKIGNAN